ncbi:MAG: glycoside hydrolase family 97 N-terminal domain-containing protein, partial [Verrucomicrobia bacterium]|nr:glycoside hydrolase family 97 N-terminal domain-containing protein [Verrucomicrobiota bacterium]
MNMIPRILRVRPAAAVVLSAGLALATADARAAVELKSPDGAFVVTFDVKDAGAPGAPVYRVDWKGRPLIVESRLGLEIEDAPLVSGLAISG